MVSRTIFLQIIPIQVDYSTTCSAYRIFYVSAMKYYCPFTLTLDPMERLLLINLTADPDEVYVGFEPQAFDDPVNGRGLIVIAYLHDGRFDVYHQPGVSLEGKNYDIVGKGVRQKVERSMAGARFDITATGVDLDVAFDDLLGRPVVLRIHETGGKPTRPFGILAPMGNTVERPPALPLFFLHDFYFVRRARTDLVISVNGRVHKPDSIPMILDGARVYFVRYTAAPFLVNWNAAFDGELHPLLIDLAQSEPGALHVADGPVTYELALADGRPALEAMSVTNARHSARIAFDPPFPDVTSLSTPSLIAGTFTIDAGPCGLVAGDYRVEPATEGVSIILHPSAGWRPGAVQWGARLIFRLVPLFRRWPATYAWRGRVDLAGPQPRLRSSWERSAAAGQGAIKLFG